MIPDADALLRDTGRACVLLGSASAIFAWFFLGGGVALGVALGAGIGWLNFWLLARALRQSVDQAEAYRGRKWALPGALLVKWPLLLLLIAGLARYTPAKAEGLAIGFAIALGSATLAAIRAQRRPPNDATPQ